MPGRRDRSGGPQRAEWGRLCREITTPASVLYVLISLRRGPGCPRPPPSSPIQQFEASRGGGDSEGSWPAFFGAPPDGDSDGLKSQRSINTMMSWFLREQIKQGIPAARPSPLLASQSGCVADGDFPRRPLRRNSGRAAALEPQALEVVAPGTPRGAGDITLGAVMQPLHPVTRCLHAI